jgi:hypothetical protein
LNQGVGVIVGVVVGFVGIVVSFSTISVNISTGLSL